MSIQDPWKVTCIADAVPFATYLSGNAMGGTFQSTPAFFQRGIEWGEEQVSDAFADIFPPNLDQQLLDIGRAALADAQYVAANGGVPEGGAASYETGTELSRPFFHEIDLQASKKSGRVRLVEIIDGQQRTTFWRCSAMTMANMMIEYHIPIIPRALSETMWTNYSRTMTFGPESSYDRLSRPFCVELHAATDAGRANIRKDHLDAYREVKTRGSDPMVKLYHEVEVQLTSIVKRIARADGAAHGGEPSVENIQAALYAVSRRMLFDCEVRINVLPKDTQSGRHFYTKNSRGAELSEHALITSALHEHTLPQDKETTNDNKYVNRWRELTARIKGSIDEGKKKTLKPEDLICHAATIALLASHSAKLAELPAEYITSLSTCQKKSSGNSFKSICVMMEDRSLDVGALLDAIEALLPDFIALYVNGADAKMTGVDGEVMSMFKLCAKGSPSHAVIMARVFGCSARDVTDLTKALTAMVTINSTYEVAAKQDLVPKIGRVGATLNHAIVSCIRKAVRGQDKHGKATPPENFATELMAELVDGSDGASPYYDKLRHSQAVAALPKITFSKNNGHLRMLMRQEWHAKNGDAAILRANEIEHILPEKPCVEAVKESGLPVKDIEKAKDDPAWTGPVSLIGNRAWLPPPTNRSVTNWSFSRKKKHFEELMSKGQGQGPDVLQLVSYKTFGQTEIDERGLQAAARIDGLWTHWIAGAKAIKGDKSKKVRVAANDASVRIGQAA